VDTFIRSHVIKHFSRFHLQYNDKWFNLLLFRINTFSIYNCFFWFGIGYSLYTSASFCGIIFGLYKGWFRFTLMMASLSNLFYIVNSLGLMDRFKSSVLSLLPLPFFIIGLLFPAKRGPLWSLRVPPQGKL